MTHISSFHTTNGLGIISFGAGAYLGYCDAKRIPITPEIYKLALAFGPAIVQGGIAAIRGCVSGLTREPNIDDKAIRTGKKGVISLRFPQYPERLNGVLMDIEIGSALGATIGGVETLVGYGVGYSLGTL